jgi:DNA-directed RNA polymerase subunit omega (EC 2.7.7.6)
MLEPSIDRLLEKVNSKYLLVTIAAKRARQLQEFKDIPADRYRSVKNVGRALEEIDQGKLNLESEDRVG